MSRDSARRLGLVVTCIICVAAALYSTVAFPEVRQFWYTVQADLVPAEPSVDYGTALRVLLNEDHSVAPSDASRQIGLLRPGDALLLYEAIAAGRPNLDITTLRRVLRDSPGFPDAWARAYDRTKNASGRSRLLEVVWFADAAVVRRRIRLSSQSEDVSERQAASSCLGWESQWPKDDLVWLQTWTRSERDVETRKNLERCLAKIQQQGSYEAER